VPFRAFISVDLPELEALKALGEELRRTGGPLKIVDPARVHLTLKFLGDTEEELVPKIVDVMRKSVAGVRPFTVRLVGTGAFPNLHRMNVLWVGMEGADPLVEIARRLEAGLEPLGYPRENRDFSPHTTIARAKDRRGLDAVRGPGDELELLEPRNRGARAVDLAVEAVRRRAPKLPRDACRQPHSPRSHLLDPRGNPAVTRHFLSWNARSLSHSTVCFNRYFWRIRLRDSTTRPTSVGFVLLYT